MLDLTAEGDGDATLELNWICSQRRNREATIAASADHFEALLAVTVADA